MLVKEMVMVAKDVVFVVVVAMVNERYVLAIQALKVDPLRGDPIHVKVYNEELVSLEGSPWLVVVQPKVPCPFCHFRHYLHLLPLWCQRTFGVFGSNLPLLLLLQVDVFDATYISATKIMSKINNEKTCIYYI